MADLAVDGTSGVDVARGADVQRVSAIAQRGVVPSAAAASAVKLANEAQRLLGVAPHNGVNERELCAHGLSAGICNNPRPAPTVPVNDKSQELMAGSGPRKTPDREKAIQWLMRPLTDPDGKPVLGEDGKPILGMSRADAEARINMDPRFKKK